MRHAIFVLSIVLLAGFAGCITASTPEDVKDAATPSSSVGFTMDGTGAGAVGFLSSYTMTHPFRIVSPAGTAPRPTMETARDDLESTLAEMGLDVQRHVYSDTGTNILAIKNGTEKPDEWIVLSAHYDTAESTVYGAWDDGAGTAMLLELARAVSKASFRHTVVLAFFDQEESGLVGSKAFVKDYYEKTTFVANMNFDPPGLNWPCADAQGPFPVKIIFDAKKTEAGMPGYAELQSIVLNALNATGIPEEVRDFDSGIPIATLNGVGLRGGSDHKSFNDLDIPNVFIGSAPTSRAGPAAALTYLLHTPLDTQAQMEARCGGADKLVQAFDVEVRLVQTALGQLDAAP